MEQHLQCTQFWALMTNSSSGILVDARGAKIRLWRAKFPRPRRLAHHAISKFVLHD